MHARYVLLLLLLTACAGGSAAAPPERPAAADLGPLALLVPEGATLVVVARPAQVVGSPPMRTVVDAIVPAELLEGFADRTGVDPRRVTEAVLAEYEGGFILIARGPFPAGDVVRAAGMRMSTVEAQSDQPLVRRRGYLGVDLRDVVALAGDVVAVGSGPEMQRMIRRVRTGRWASGGPALASDDAGALFEEHGRARLALFAPRPLELPPGLGASVLLARQRALAATARPSGPDAVAFEVSLRGEFPEGSAANFRAWVESIAEDELGAALGISEGLETLRIQTDRESVALRITIPAATLARGLRVLFVADLRELLAEPGAEVSPEP